MPGWEEQCLGRRPSAVDRFAKSLALALWGSLFKDLQGFVEASEGLSPLWNADNANMVSHSALVLLS